MGRASRARAEVLFAACYELAHAEFVPPVRAQIRRAYRGTPPPFPPAALLGPASSCSQV